MEGTENRITVARKRYIDQVAEFNSQVRLGELSRSLQRLSSGRSGLRLSTEFTVSRGSGIRGGSIAPDGKTLIIEAGASEFRLLRFLSDGRLDR